MSYKDVQGRRLNLQAALETTLRDMPRLWSGAGGVLVVATLLCLVPKLLVLPQSAELAAGSVAAVLVLIAFGALARLSITDDLAGARALGLGPQGYQFAWAEVRLVGAALLCLIFLSMVIAILALVVLAIFGMAELNVAAIQARDWAAVGVPWKLAVLGVVGLGALLIPLLLVVRLSLFIPASLGRRQMVSLNSMGIAYGSFWQILAGLIATAVPTIVLLGVIGSGFVTEPTASVAWIVAVFGLQLPLTLGFLGAAYRQLEYWSPEEPR